MKMCRGLIDRLLLLAAFGITVQGMSPFLSLVPSPLCRTRAPSQIPTILAPLPLSSILRFSLARSAAFTAPASPVSRVNNVRGVLVIRDADSTRRYAPVSTRLNEIPDIPTDILSIAFTPDASTGSGSDSISIALRDGGCGGESYSHKLICAPSLPLLFHRSRSVESAQIEFAGNEDALCDSTLGFAG